MQKLKLSEINALKKVILTSCGKKNNFLMLREAIFKNHAGPKIDPFKF